jgi:hypothetical protein
MKYFLKELAARAYLGFLSSFAARGLGVLSRPFSVSGMTLATLGLGRAQPAAMLSHLLARPGVAV